MASRGPKVDLRDALLDTPKFHVRLLQLDNSLAPFRDYVALLRDTFQACHIHQEKLSEGTIALVNLLGSIDNELGEKSSTTSSNAFAQLARYQNELHSCQEMLNSQLKNSVVDKFSALLEEDMARLQSMKEACESSRLEHDQAMARYSRVSKRKDTEKSRFETNAELYAARKKFYQSSLDYYSELNKFQMKKKYMLLEPVLTFMHAQMGYFKACHEIMNISFQQLLTNLNSDIQGYHKDYEHEARELTQRKTELELQLPVMCVPDPDPSDPFTAFPSPNTQLTTKHGYLFLRTQKGGLAGKWDRTFFFTKNGYLYTQSPQKTAEALLHLKDAEAFPSDSDDRRYVLQVTHPSLKKPVFLQAENETQRTEWISALKNNSLRKLQHAVPAGQGADATRLRTRLYDTLERERIRTWAAKELQDPSSGPAVKLEKSPSGYKVTLPSPFSSTGGSRSRSKSPQRSLGLLGRGHKKQNSGPEQQLVDVQSLVDVAVTTSTSTRPPPPPPQQTLQPQVQAQDGGHSANSSLPAKFQVKYLGQAEVREARNNVIISEAIREVMTTRAMRKVKPAHSIELSITHKNITLTDTSSKKMVGGFKLKDILNCAPHPENDMLFGVVCRVATEPDKVKYVCNVMESERSGAQVCAAISSAIQTAWKMMQTKSGRRKSEDSIPVSLPPVSTTSPHKEPVRPPPPFSTNKPVVPSLLYSYSPAPSGLPSHRSTSSVTMAMTSVRPTQGISTHRSSSDSNLLALGRAGSRTGEEVGGAGGGAMLTISELPPSLPPSSSTSADSLGPLEEVEETGNRQTATGAASVMFADLVEETEEVALISFDQNGSAGPSIPANTSAFSSDGYVSSDLSRPIGPTSPSVPPPTTMSGSSHPVSSMSTYLSLPSAAPSTSVIPSTTTSVHLSLSPGTNTRLTPSPPLPHHTSPSPTSSPSFPQPSPPPPKPAISPPPPSATQPTNTTAATTAPSTTPSLASTLGFDTMTQAEIDNLIELMSPTDETPPHPADSSGSGYLTGNQVFGNSSSSYVSDTNWANFNESKQ